MERLIKEEPVDKDKALKSMSTVKNTIIQTHQHLKETWTHMRSSVSLLWVIIRVAKQLKSSKTYKEILNDDADFMEEFLDDVSKTNMDIIKIFMKWKWIEISEEELKLLEKRQKLVMKNRLSKKIDIFEEFKIFVEDLIEKTQDFWRIIKRIKILKDELTYAKRKNKEAQDYQKTSIDLMEVLCDDFDEQQKVDELTWLGSKKYFESMGMKFIEEKREFHVVFIDLNGLKLINDNYGHDAGDSLLRDFAKDLANVLWTENNTPFRLHGDEFTIISEDDLSTISHKMSKLTEWLERRHYKIMKDGKVIHIEGKFAYGITKKEDGDSLLDMKWRAESKMYAHKARMKWEENKYNFANEKETA